MKHTLQIFCFIILTSFFFQSRAQLFENKKGFTLADTLRGSLRPERTCFDVTFYNLNVRIDPGDSSVMGMVSTTFNVVEKTKRIQLDLFDNMNIQRIIYHNKDLEYERKFNAVFINFPVELAEETKHTVTVIYNGKPIVAKNPPWDGGFIWKKTADGKPWVGVACQGTGASLWWPNKDTQTDEPDSMLISITCPDDLMNVSNGRLIRKYEYGKGWNQWDWRVTYPINNYNVTVNIAPYEHFSDTLNKLSLDYYVLPENLDKAKEQFKQVKTMLNCFQKYFGEYPFVNDGYKLVDSWHLGMEHQSAIAYGNKYMNGYLGKSLSVGSEEGKKFDYIIVHESAHEWFGNSLTTEDIADMWVHEGFAMYAEALYVECNWGADAYQKYMNGLRPGIMNRKPVIGPYGVNEEGSDMYNKGAWVIHTIRSLIHNDSIFFKALRELCRDYKYKNITSKQVEFFWYQSTGLQLTKIFDQYLRHASIPVLEMKMAGDTVMYRYKTDVEGFNLPLKVSVKGAPYQWIFPITEWAMIDFANKFDDVKIAEDLFLIKVVKLKD